MGEPANSRAWNEADRLAALHAYDVLDSEPEAAFDDITRLIARVCEAPIAVINLIDADRQWFKSEVGLGVRETPLDTSFCRHALFEQDRMVIPDATQDDRFACNPLVTGEMGLRFYAGVLLKADNGLPIGTLCVLDTEVRPDGLTDLQMDILTVLAKQVVSQLDLRRIVRAGARALIAQRQLVAERDDAAAARDARDDELARITLALVDSEAKFRAIADTMPQMVWSTRPDGFHDYYNARWYEFTGMPEGSTDGDGWNGIFHPDDQAWAWERWSHSLATGEPYDIEYRLRHHSGVYRWTLGRALPIRDADGQIQRWFGTCTDIDDIKADEQRREVLSQELSHRIKNVFAVISALVALSARQHPEARPFADSLRTRIQALARAHDFVRPHTARADPGAGVSTLHAFLRELMAPYSGDESARIVISGDDAVFDDQAATPVALLFHELATNAAKYGALSVGTGSVSIVTRLVEDGFELAWTETGGPPVTVPERMGFGLTLANLAVEGQLGGKISRDWRPEGLALTALLPVTALSRRRFSQLNREPDTATRD